MDCRHGLAMLPDNSVDAILTDPPYELGFMGKAWDKTGIAYDVELWREALRVLKPGGHMLAFSSARTYHRMACAIEDSGFDIRDQIMWVYGSGFPKSKNLDGELQGWGTALKPAHEPICMARKPLIGTVAANVLAHGTGAINIDGCRVGSGAGTNLTASEHNEAGRWPANLIHDGSDEVLSAFPDAPGQLANASTNGEARKTQNVYGSMRRGRGDEPSATSDNAGHVGFKMKPGERRLDAGSAARFFYCAKASKSERGADNKHPTVKPIKLGQYLARLICPKGGTLVDIFAGSGSFGVAAKLEGFDFLGFDTDVESVTVGNARIELAQLTVDDPVNKQ
jgi:site-specific DNA-methyltransferase (adenine-specific)